MVCYLGELGAESGKAGELIECGQTSGPGMNLDEASDSQDVNRIASPRNVPETSSVASPSMLPLPHWPPAGPQLLFHFINQCLLMLALWSCGRRPCVVQAQRQIHRALRAALGKSRRRAQVT